MFEPAEESFDEIALAIEGEIRLAWSDTIRLGRNDGGDIPALERVDQGVAIIGLVGQERLGLDLVQQGSCLADIGRLSGREGQGNRVAERIDDGMDLGGQPAAGATDGLILAFFFWAPALC